MRLTSRHAELIGGRMVEPGEEFEESKLDSEELDRLKAEGKAREVAASKKSSSKGDA
jgi:hypothetical protein